MKSNRLQKSSSPSNYPFFMQGREDVIFVHIPKTGGTSIRRALKMYKTNLDPIPIKKHNDRAEIIDLIGEEKWNSSFKFTFVRNPWERLVSHYFFRKRKNKTDESEKLKTFENWVTMIVQSRLRKKAFLNIRQQVNWIKDADGQIQMDFIGRFERINQDFEQLQKLINTSAQLPHTNKNPIQINYRDFYSSSLKAIVAKIYEEDIDTFGYTF